MSDRYPATSRRATYRLLRGFRSSIDDPALRQRPSGEPEWHMNDDDAMHLASFKGESADAIWCLPDDLDVEPTGSGRVRRQVHPLAPGARGGAAEGRRQWATGEWPATRGAGDVAGRPSERSRC